MKEEQCVFRPVSLKVSSIFNKSHVLVSIFFIYGMRIFLRKERDWNKILLARKAERHLFRDAVSR